MPDVVQHLRLVLRPRDELRHHRVLRREHEERGAEERVRTRREDRQLLPAPLDAEDDASALRAADPVALHREDAVRPVLEQRHLVEQLIGVVGDPEEPLRQVLRLDLVAAALAAAVDHLLVREHGLVVRAPLDRSLLAVGEARARRSAGRATASSGSRPGSCVEISRAQSIAQPMRCICSRMRGDVPLGDRARVAALLDGGVLGRQAERVVAHRAEHQHALPAPQMRDHVADRVVERVPHVEVARGVREHLDDVRLRRSPRASSSGSGFGTWNDRSSAQTCCHFASIACGS